MGSVITLIVVISKDIKKILNSPLRLTTYDSNGFISWVIRWLDAISFVSDLWWSQFNETNEIRLNVILIPVKNNPYKKE